MVNILIILVLILLNGFFSLAEVALISARKSRLQADAKAGSRAARAALNLQANPDTFLSVAQIGITIVSILTGIFSGAELSDSFARVLQSWGVDAGYAPALSKVIIVVIATYLSCAVGELLPKRVGIDMAERMAKLTAPPMVFLSKIGKPLVWLLSKNMEGFVHLLGLHSEENKVTEEEIKSIIQEGTDAGEVKEVEQDIMERALVLGDQTVESLMTHRADIVFLDTEMTADEIEHILATEMYAAYPVINPDDPDDVLGIVTVKDLVLNLHKPDFSLQKVIHKPLYFPENMTVYGALEQLKKSKFNRALVCDEYGSVQGIIVLRDILEGLVGNIPDETEMPDIVENPDHTSWTVSGQCPFYDFLAQFDKEDLYTPDINTVGGLILERLERIPHVGEQIEWGGFSFRVVGMDGTRIDRVIVRCLPQPEEGGENDSAKNHDKA